MWSSSRKLILDCFHLVLQCVRRNVDVDELDLDEISEYEENDVPVHFQPQTFATPVPLRRDDFQHRPDTPCTRRRSPPEILLKMRQALEEMGEGTATKSDQECGDQPFPFSLMSPSRIAHQSNR
ncbi:uncharacterized protein LOC117178784 [Belonocnema kinseyi]|uniref:uncharacterized protein LOC117178784 n=1 Tax=Belonocnema kinseyi TaxID=2817044 RepID=UPI00143DEA53|nr:uncharacterized protein LOC117178784 [Belonocnema kinseyi]